MRAETTVATKYLQIKQTIKLLFTNQPECCISISYKDF
jgi:hypothetical protein